MIEGLKAVFKFLTAKKPPTLESILKKVRNNRDYVFTDEEMAIVLDKMFNCEFPEDCYYSVNRDYSNNMVFHIVKIIRMLDGDNNIKDIVLELKDLTYNSSISFYVPVRHFEEFTRKVKITT